MDGVSLEDRLSRARGIVARKTGLHYVVYRPAGAADPLAPRNRVLRLPASFTTSDRGVSAPAGMLCGRFDAVYTRAGDYLAGTEETYFVASQNVGEPVLCVRINATVDVFRRAAALASGYGGRVRGQDQQILGAWPIRLEAGGMRGGDGAAGQFGTYVGRLPVLPPLPSGLRIGDVLVDGFGQNFAVTATEQSSLGWRLLLRQVAA
jgi:hypothetical protein